MPKAHLHLHLTAAMRPHTCAELARRGGIELPPATHAWASFGAFAASYHGAGAVLRYPEDLRRLVWEMVEDARDDGAVWIEPQTSLHQYRAITGSDEATLELLLAAADAATRAGTGVGLVISANREHDSAEAVRLAHLASRYAEHGLVGFGLGGDERHSPELFAGSFPIAREAGLLKVPHAGEFSGPGSVRRALDALGADRVQHGIRAVEDADLITRLARGGTCLDVCPSSNVALGITSWDRHPLPELLAKGVACSVNADGPLLSAPACWVSTRPAATASTSTTISSPGSRSPPSSPAPHRRARKPAPVWRLPTGRDDHQDHAVGEVADLVPEQGFRGVCAPKSLFGKPGRGAARGVRCGGR